jgi:hypothetical protein
MSRRRMCKTRPKSGQIAAAKTGGLKGMREGPQLRVDIGRGQGAAHLRLAYAWLDRWALYLPRLAPTRSRES